VVRGRAGAAAVKDAWRLAVGTLTVLPVRPPASADRRTAGTAMTLAPLVGLVLGLLVLAPLWLLGAARWPNPVAAPPVAAALAVAAVAALTRGMHLDGLADTADGRGSGRPPEDALEVMRRGDVGPFGVAAVVLCLLLQVVALEVCLSRGPGPLALVGGLVAGRAVLPVLCRRGVPAARPRGLGATVAGSVAARGLLLSLVLTVASLALAAAVPGGPPSAATGWTVLRPAVALLASYAVGWGWGRHCVRRLGGVTGDVLGSTVELSTTAWLVVMSLG